MTLLISSNARVFSNALMSPGSLPKYSIRCFSVIMPLRELFVGAVLYRHLEGNGTITAMPSKRIGGFLCYFVSYDCVEPPHIHLVRGKERNAPGAKFWLEPIQLERNRGLNTNELREARAIVQENRKEFLEMWDEHRHD